MMTNKEAIFVLRTTARLSTIHDEQAVKKAVQMATEALRKQEPIKPIETTDKAWGIPSRQAVCPKCDCYLGHIAFLDEYKGKKITYCETCGQAIDWEGWVHE